MQVYVCVKRREQAACSVHGKFTLCQKVNCILPCLEIYSCSQLLAYVNEFNLQKDETIIENDL